MLIAGDERRRYGRCYSQQRTDSPPPAAAAGPQSDGTDDWMRMRDGRRSDDDDASCPALNTSTQSNALRRLIQRHSANSLLTGSCERPQQRQHEWV